MMKRIVLCADDYGQAPPISQGILDLIKQGRLSATSCLVNTPFWLDHASWLVPYAKQIDIGLHFNLTQGGAISSVYQKAYGDKFFPLPTLMRKAWLGQLDSMVIAAELEAQLDKFAAAMGVLPNFIDGHQHVHQFPIIRDALVQIYQRRFAGTRTYIRLVNERLGLLDLITNTKKYIIYLSGTPGLRQLLCRDQIPHNDSFAGVYDFAKADQYPIYFREFLSSMTDKGLIMCHPGLVADDKSDEIALSRPKEYQYFMSDEFVKDCADQQIDICHWS